ncbi:MAG: AzlC family ABC transporter permease [Paeniglutamicibacter sp.]
MRSIFRTIGRSTVHESVMVSLSVGVVGISYGALGRDMGLDFWQVVLLAGTVLGAASELLFINVIGSGGSPAVAVLAGLMVNSRNLAYAVGAGKFLPSGWRTVLGAHLVNDESVAMALGKEGTEKQRATFWLVGLGIFVAWPGGAAIGAWLGSVVSPTALGLDSAFPALLLCMAANSLRNKTTLLAASIGAIFTLVASPFVPAGLAPAMALLGVAVVYLTSKRRRRVSA